jgi:transcriptional regulator with XRE-family HTH domain
MGFWLRYNRIKNGLTQEDAARKLGMKNIFSYQRLEHGCNTSLAMLSKLADTFPLFKINAVF